MKIRSLAVDVVTAITCLGGSWNCGGTDSSSAGTRKSQPAQMASGEHGNQKGECSPIGVKRKDYLLHVVSTLPGSLGEPAELDIHRVSPVYEHGWCTHPNGGAAHAVILVAGATTESVTTFDLQYPEADVVRPQTDEERGRHDKAYEYSLMESLARAGVETFSVNLLGYGLSSRFELDDPCSTSQAEQLRLLVPNPLSAACPNPPNPLHFTNTNAAGDQLAAVVEHVLEEVDVEKVSFFSWSRGGNVVGAYASRDASKVERLIFLASEFETAGNPQQFALLVADRTQAFTPWNSQLSNDPKVCPGERDPAILDAIWTSARMRDPLGSSWGSSDALTGGVRRAPTWDLLNWNPTTAAKIQVPTLVLSGLRDNQNPTSKQEKIYNNLGSSSKVLLKIDCASHNALWEGSTSASGWKGPHATLHDAAAQWITTGTFHAATKGTFNVSSAGAVAGPF
jgi:pimeloyl-ACP methyl ester carboxylesterase